MKTEILSCVNQAMWISFCMLSAVFPFSRNDLWNSRKTTCVLLSPRLQQELEPS